jgi:Domain of unknown function (DUF4157)
MQNSGPQTPLSSILQLQQSIGNRALQRLLKNRGARIQPKLAVGGPYDRYEREADTVAEQVSGTQVNPAAVKTPPQIQPFSEASSDRLEVAPTSVERALSSPASSLDPGLKHDMEQRFGRDFSAVQVHSGEEASQSARELNAKAYTVGNNVIFGEGQFSPESQEGRQLVAHELTHVVQQRSAQAVQRAPVSPPLDPGVRSERATRISNAIEQRERRRLAERDRPLEPDFDLGWDLRHDRDRPVELKGNPVLQLSATQRMLIALKEDDETTRIPVQFGHLARGDISVVLREEGIYTDHPYVISLDHPGLPSLDKDHVPALLVEVNDGQVTGKIVLTSEQASGTASATGFRTVDKSNVARLLGLEDLQNLQIGDVGNGLLNGHLVLDVLGMSYDLDGKFHGGGKFLLLDETHSLQADAAVEAQGVDKSLVHILRDELGQLSAHAELNGTLTPKAGHVLSGKLTADFRRGLFEIRGVLFYRSPKIVGEVTVVVTDEAAAWKLVTSRLGDKAPLPQRLASAPNGLAMTGWGWVDFNLNEWLTGHAEVIVDPAGFITALGRLAPTKEIQVFPEKSKDKTFDPWEVGEHVVVWGLPGWIGGSATLSTHASVGPGTLGNVVIDGYFSTYEDKPAQFSVRGVLAVPATASADLLIEAGGHVGIKGIRLGIYAKVTGSAELRAYAAVEPHIGRTQLADGSPGFFIRGRLEAGAGLFLGLRGALEAVTPSPFPNLTIYDFGNHSWYVGGGSISVEGTYFLGGKQPPSFDFDIANKLNPTGLVDTLLWHPGRLGSGGKRETNFGKSFHDWVKHGEFERNVADTPKLPASEESVKVETPTLAEHVLPPFTEPEETPAAQPRPATPGPGVSATSTTSSGQPPNVSPVTPAPTPASQTTPGPPSQATPAAPALGQPTEHAPALEAPFSMLKTPHTLYLEREGVPRIWMESTRSPLGMRISDMRRFVDRQHQAALATGVPVGGTTVGDLETELKILTDLENETSQVEAEAFNRTHDISVGVPAHIPGFRELAARIQSYADMCGRSDILAALATSPPPHIRPAPVDLAVVMRKLDLHGIKEQNKRDAIIENLNNLPAGPEIEGYIASPMFDDLSTNFEQVLRQLANPGMVGAALSCLKEAEQLHLKGFKVRFEEKGPGARKSDPDYWDVDVASIAPSTGDVLRAIAVKRIRFFDRRDPGDNQTLRDNLNEARAQLRNFPMAKEKWVVIHVGTATAKDLTTSVADLLKDFRTNNPDYKVRVLLSDGTEDTD